MSQYIKFSTSYLVGDEKVSFIKNLKIYSYTLFINTSVHQITFVQNFCFILKYNMLLNLLFLKSVEIKLQVNTYEKAVEAEKVIEVVKIEPIVESNEVKENLLTGNTLRNSSPENKLPEGVSWNFDAENWLDHLQVSTYAMDIFQYLKGRETLFVIMDYMERQVCLSRWMRAMLVDWMVEVQESFELNHETLYLAVKLVDLYLTKVTVGKETLQLLGAASLFIASKYDVSFTNTQLY